MLAVYAGIKDTHCSIRGKHRLLNSFEGDNFHAQFKTKRSPLLSTRGKAKCLQKRMKFAQELYMALVTSETS